MATNTDETNIIVIDDEALPRRKKRKRVNRPNGIPPHQSPSDSSDGNSSDSSESPPLSDRPYRPWLYYDTLTPNNMGPRLTLFYTRLLDFQKHKGIISNTLRSHFQNSSDPISKSLDDEAFYEPTWKEPRQERRLLPIVKEIVQSAEKCCSQEFDKTGWNSLVYTPILSAALQNMMPYPDRQGVDFAPCERAAIRLVYEKFSIAKPHVDFMLYMVPSATNDRLAHKALLKRRDEHGSVNFTPFRPTSKYPVGLTIKSKDGENRLSPEVHLSAWQAAQWRSLCEMAGSDIKGLEFLPGIIVDGHEWKFIATTWKNGRTTLLSSLPLGSTTTEVGVYRIMAGIKLLSKWVVYVFWPWYREFCLGLEPMEQNSQSTSQPGMPQPGMPQQGMPQPGMSQPNMSQPGMSQGEASNDVGSSSQS
ncbi:hypothetical protein FPOA_09022 [Fusarium poae]|uniref:PD-(D/E)XK nuclease-like domain-containing protein n=1 Tax=Fusarium poae TaxID=36050 RepID=A0A1B8AQD4_FUSPO|nr:hypothetical protein FPOA_09022 [Fusarium poae]